MDYETEEQQVEAIKKWWKENGKLVVTGVTLGIALVVGIRFYNQYENERAETASYLFDKVITTQPGNAEEIETLSKQIITEYADTAYAALSSLIVAKQFMAEGKLDDARQKLEWVIANTGNVEIQHIARLRLIRVLNSLQQYDQALAVSNIDYPQSFESLYEELKGDAYLAKGDINQARIAYDKAISSAGMQANRWLKLKRDDLGKLQLDEPSA